MVLGVPASITISSNGLKLPMSAQVPPESIDLRMPKSVLA